MGSNHIRYFLFLWCILLLLLAGNSNSENVINNEATGPGEEGIIKFTQAEIDAMEKVS